VTASSGNFNICSGANLTTAASLNVTGGTFSATDSTSTLTASLNYTSGSNSTFMGVIAGSGNTVTLNSVGITLVLSGVNTYTGATNVMAGTLNVPGSIASGSTVNIGTGGTLAGFGLINGNVTLTGNGVIDWVAFGRILGTLTVTGGNWNGFLGPLTPPATVSGLVTSSSGNFNIGNTANLVAVAGVNVTGGTISTTDSTSTITGSLTYSSSANSTFAGVIAGAGNTVTVNSGTLTLNGTNTYTGATNVTGGTLAVNGSISSASNVNVATGAITLGATGQVAGNITIGGGGIVNGNGGIGGTVTVNNGGILGGGVHVTGNVAVNSGGSTYPGDPQIQTLSTVTYLTGSSAQFAIANNRTPNPPWNVTPGTDHDQIVITNPPTSGSTTLTIGTAVTLQINLTTAALSTLQAHVATNYVGGGANTGADNYYLYSLGTGASSGQFATLTLTGLGTSGTDTLTGTINYSGSNDRFNGVSNLGDVVASGRVNGVPTSVEFALSYAGNEFTNSTIGGNDVVLTETPEPSCVLLLGSGFVAFIVFGRRSKYIRRQSIHK
jgi:autotransporter-associated beta strand protein